MSTAGDPRETDPELPRYVQLLWDREPAGRRGPKPRVSIEQIGNAAAELADRDGFDAVSMKAVADGLGMTAMSLYRYVDSKDDLVDLMLNVGYGEPDMSWTSGVGWRAGLDRWAREIAARLVARPWMIAAHAASSRAPLGPNVLLWEECGLAAFDGVDLPETAKLSSMLLLDGFVRSHVAQSIQLGQAGDDFDPTQPHEDRYHVFVGQLVTPDRFPLLTAAAAAAAADHTEFYGGELDFGIGVILDGLAAKIERTASL
jgi:AcrR family transcriptional regulator